MKKISRLFLFVSFSLVLLMAACAQATPTTIFVPTQPGEETASPPPLGTDAPASPVATLETPTVTSGTELTSTPGTDATQTAGVPVTGGELILLECQFCIQDTAHALLVLPESATFETAADTAAVSTPGPDSGCNAVDTYNGRQVILCRSQENTSINLNICTDASNCTQLLVVLQDCPNVVQPGAAATGTLEIGAPTNTGEAGVTDTPDPSVNPTATP